MSDLDRDLSNRLSRLADAVPVSRGRLDPVHRGAVEARQRVRMAWVTPLVFVVAAVLLTSVLGFGPHAPGATDGPLSATTRSGDFELTIRSGKARYAAGEPIDISASLTYLGAGDPIAIQHDIGQDGRPIGFGVVEPIFGGYHLSGGVSRLMCHRTSLSPGEVLSQPFKKTGGGYEGDVVGFTAYMRDPVFWLDAGTWHPYAMVRFSPGSCGVDELGGPATEVNISAEIEIEVAPRDEPPPSASPSPNPPQTLTVRDGDFELALHAGKSHYRTDEPVDVTATLAYLGTEPSVEITTDGGPLSFAIREKVFGAIRVGGVSLLTCDRTTLEQDRPLVEGFQKSGGFSNDHPDAKMFRDWMQDPELLLPEGTWHLSVSAGGPCLGDGPTFSVRAEIEIVVSDDPTATPGVPVPTEWADPPVYGGDDDGSASLQLRSSHASYAEGMPIELEAKYWFADGLALVASHDEPELLLSIIQLDANNPTKSGTSYDTVCTDLGRADGTEHQVDLAGYNVAVMWADRVPARLEDLFVGGALVLPVGRWEISANVEGRFAPCGQAGDGYALSASVVIEVVPG